MNLMPFMEALKELVLIGTALAGATVAIKGLGTWRHQLRGKTDYDLARRLLISTYRLRDAINGVRRPAIWSYELPSPPEDKAKNMSAAQIRHFGTSQAYEARWENVQKIRTELYADLLEAEAIWGQEPRNLFQPVRALEHELWVCVTQYLESIDPDTDPESKKALRDIRKSKRDILYDDLSEEGDEFKGDLVRAISSIETYLKAKLTR